MLITVVYISGYCADDSHHFQQFKCFFFPSRQHHLLWKGRYSWASRTRWAAWAKNLREMCCCRTLRWWKVSSFPSEFWESWSEEMLLYLLYVAVSPIPPQDFHGLFCHLCTNCIFLAVRAVTWHQLTTMETSGSKRTLQLPFDTSERCLASALMTTWYLSLRCIYAMWKKCF